jgi:hypothetical protein
MHKYKVQVELKSKAVFFLLNCQTYEGTIIFVTVRAIYLPVASDIRIRRGILTLLKYIYLNIVVFDQYLIWLYAK